MKIEIAKDLQEKFNKGYQLAGEDDEGNLLWFNPPKKTAGEKIIEALESKEKAKNIK